MVKLSLTLQNNSYTNRNVVNNRKYPRGRINVDFRVMTSINLWTKEKVK